MLDGIAQEVDIETGEVLFEWHSLEHVALKESYWKPKKDQEEPFDYFHINLGTAPRRSLAGRCSPVAARTS